MPAIRTNPWILASRPKTLFAAIAPVLVGTGVAVMDGAFTLLPALAALLGAVFIQIGTNLANDVADFRRGADAGRRLGPLRVTQAGLLSPHQVTRGMWLSFGLAAVCGIYLTMEAGWPVVVIGLASILAGIAYTAGPFPLGYHGLGDGFVFVFFGLVAVGGTYYVQAGRLSATAILAGMPVGFLATAIIVVNNLRDLENDRRVGKRTLAVRLGRRGTQGEFVLLIVGAYLAPVLIWLGGLSSPWLNLTWLSAPLAVAPIRRVLRARGAALNKALAQTSLLELIFSLLLALGFSLS